MGSKVLIVPMKTRTVRKVPAAIATRDIDDLVFDIIGQVADRRIMYVLEALTEHGTMRFTRLSEAVGNISQKMLTQTLRQMERDGLVTESGADGEGHVVYEVTDAGRMLGLAEAVQEGPWRLPARVMAEAMQQQARGLAMMSSSPGLRTWWWAAAIASGVGWGRR